MPIIDRLLGRNSSDSEKLSTPEDISPSVVKCPEGARVKCAKCGKQVVVRYAKKDLAFATDSAMSSVALRCQSCGFITCHSCAVPGGSSISGSVPVCPSCGAVGGPYFFEP